MSNNRFLPLSFYLILVTLSTLVSADIDNYGISNSSCLCNFEKIPKRPTNHRCMINPECYPNHDTLDISADCLPSIPENSRVCMRTMVKSCRDEEQRPYLACRFFPGPEDFKPQPLPRSCQDSIELSSVSDSEFRTFCMYKVNMSDTENCSALRIQSVVDHPEEEYIDSLNETHPCRVSDNECKDYLQIYYHGEDGNRQTQILCREELAILENMIVPAASFTAVFWSDSTYDPDATRSFHIRAECLDYGNVGSAYTS